MKSSNKKIIALVIVLVLLSLLFFVFKDKIGKGIASNNSSGVTTTDDETTLSGSMYDLIKLGNTTKCTYSTEEAGTKMVGTTYVSGKNMRSDTEITSPEGTKIESYMISDGTWVYTWTSAMPQGFKMKIDEAEKPATTGDSSNVAVKDFQNKFDFKCSKWSVDKSKFEVPSNIPFTDFSETMKNTTESACSACYYAESAEEKAQCLAQLGCK